MIFQETNTPAAAVSEATETIAWLVNAKEKKEAEPVNTISYIELYRYATNVDKLLIILAIISAFLSGGVTPVTVYLESDLLRRMVEYDRYEESEQAKKDEFWNSILHLAFLYLTAGLVQCIVTYMSYAFINVSAVNQTNVIRLFYLRAALNQDAAYYDLRRSGDFASKMADDMNNVMYGIGDQVTTMVSSVTLVVISLVWALVTGWKMSLVCFSLVPVALLLIALAAWTADKYSIKENQATGEASAIAAEVLSSLRTVYAFGGQQKELERYCKPLAQATKFSIRKELLWGLSDGLIEFFMFTCYAFFFYVGIYLLIKENDKYNAGIFYTVYKNVSNVGFALGGMREHLSAFGHAKGTGANIFSLIDNVPRINPLLNRGIQPASMEGNIEFRGVWFNYPSRPNHSVLKELNFSIKRGQSVALVGATGSGKSTVIQLLCRFYDVVEGNILLDDYDLRELSVRWLRSNVGLVGQEPVLFNTSIRENIRYGREDATDEEIEAAAITANAHQFIIKLPKGYDTLVGERGASLSGGQKQRVAIARALVRDPRVLLLDEATSALDTASEAKVQRALDKAAEGRTTIIIAHRLSTIRNADIIHVLSKGQIIESGSHTELMNLQRHYFNMVMTDEPGYFLNEKKRHKRKDSAAEFDVDDTNDDNFSRKDTTIITEQESVMKMITKSLHELKVSNCKVLSLNKPEWKYIAAGSVLTFVESVALTVFGIFVSYIIASFPASKANDLMTKAYHSAALLVLFGIITGNARFWQTFLFGISGAKLTERLRRLMFQQLLRQEMGYFDDKRNTTGALCARLFGEAASVRAVTGFRIGHLLMAVTQIVVCVLAAFYIDWRLALVSLASLPVSIFSFITQSKSARDESVLHAKTMEESSETAMEALSNYRTVASLSRELGVLREYEKQLEPRRRFLTNSAHISALILVVNNGLRMLTIAAIFTYGGFLMTEEDLRYAYIFSVLQVSVAIQQGTASVFSYAPEVQKGYHAASRILQLLNRETTIKDPKDPACTDFLGSGEGSFQEVQFCYPSRPNIEVLSQLNLTIQKGKTHALVGHSGCGKSTVIQLLERFYDPDDGQITLDTFPIKGLLLSDVRRTMGLVSQEPVLFDRTIGENIAYGDNTRSPTQEEIAGAAKQANIHLFIVSLPLGYDTNIGPQGTQLSGGQKQCVAIARALLRKPQLLLLDEATSALDAESEKVVQATLDKAKAGRTSISIAHRLSSVRDADVIYVIKNGHVEEQGTHEQLMALEGHYYALNQRHVFR